MTTKPPATPSPVRYAATEASTTSGGPPDSGSTSLRAQLGLERRGHHGADRGDRDQRRHARDLVVDPARHAGVVLRHRAEDGVRERRHGGRQPEAEDEHAREQIGEVVHVRAQPAHPDQADPGHDRPEAHQQPRADLVRQRAEAARQDPHHERDRDQRQPGGDRAVAGDLLEEDHDEERRGTEPAVDQQRRQVADREVPRARTARAASSDGRSGARARRTRPASSARRRAGSRPAGPPSRTSAARSARTRARPGRATPAARRGSRSSATPARRGSPARPRARTTAWRARAAR